MKKLIRILKDTPFHKAGIELSIVDFRLAYSFICTTSTTNDELIKHIEADWKLTKGWFQVIDKIDLEPLVFVYEDLWYVKEFDGMYHAFVSPLFYMYFVAGGKHHSYSVKVITIPEARRLISEAKYTKEILYCTNDVNKKL